MIIFVKVYVIKSVLGKFLEIFAVFIPKSIQNAQVLLHNMFHSFHLNKKQKSVKRGIQNDFYILFLILKKESCEPTYQFYVA